MWLGLHFGRRTGAVHGGILCVDAACMQSRAVEGERFLLCCCLVAIFPCPPSITFYSFPGRKRKRKALPWSTYYGRDGRSRQIMDMEERRGTEEGEREKRRKEKREAVGEKRGGRPFHLLPFFPPLFLPAATKFASVYLPTNLPWTVERASGRGVSQASFQARSPPPPFLPSIPLSTAAAAAKGVEKWARESKGRESGAVAEGEEGEVAWKFLLELSKLVVLLLRKITLDQTI